MPAGESWRNAGGALGPMLGTWAALRIPPLRACAPLSHAYCSPYPGMLSLVSQLPLLGMLCLREGGRLWHFCLALQHEANFTATMFLKERELHVLRSIGNAPACQATAYHACSFASSAHLTRSRLLIRAPALRPFRGGAGAPLNWPECFFKMPFCRA